MKEPSDIFGPQIALQLCQNSVWALGAVSGKIDQTASMPTVENCAVQALIDAPRIMSQEADAPTVQRRTQGGAGPKAVFGILQSKTPKGRGSPTFLPHAWPAMDAATFFGVTEIQEGLQGVKPNII